MKDLLDHIEELKKQLDLLQPLNAENQQRLDKKFRMEWNYNSNHIEGNTLTYGETILLLINGDTKGQHEVREFDEMRGHDIALKLIQDLAADTERNLTEAFIRQINQIILKEPFYKDAKTSDGQSTKRLIKIGEYKSMPNHVQLVTGEMFYYATPEETPSKMFDLMNWYNEASQNNDFHPIEVAAELHYKFVCIHPFDDGNGRISRLLMNYHLLKNGYPPVIIKSADKKNYLFALHEADTGNIEAFKNYIAEQLVWSCEISIKAARGESIDEVGDWEKKLKLLNQKINPSLELEKKKSAKIIFETLNNSIFSLIDLLLTKWTSINDLFFDHFVQMNIHNYGSTGNLKKPEAFKGFFEGIEKNVDKQPEQAQINYHLEGFKKNGINTFNIRIPISILFKEYYYQILIEQIPSIKIEKYYHQSLNKNDEEIIATAITNLIISAFEKNKS